MVATKSRILTVLAVVGLAAACDQPGPLVPVDDAPVVAAAVTLPTAALPNEVWVCKDAPAGSFSFTVSLSQAAPGATVHQANPTIAADACMKVASGGGAVATVAETDPSPYLFDKVEVWHIPLHDPTTPVLTGTFTPANWTASAQYGDRGLIFVFYNVSPPSTGCTLTQGYWKTHSEYGPAPYDATWAQLSNGADTPFFLSGQTWHDVFWTSVSGNAYYILAHQYMAARLNELAGASTSAVAGALAAAQTLFETWTPADIDPLKGRDALVKQFKDLATELDNYNNGVTGPGHCSDVPI